MVASFTEILREYTAASDVVNNIKLSDNPVFESDADTKGECLLAIVRLRAVALRLRDRLAITGMPPNKKKKFEQRVTELLAAFDTQQLFFGRHGTASALKQYELLRAHNSTLGALVADSVREVS